MNRDKELFRLAREHVMLTDLLIKDRINEEEYKEDVNEIEMKRRDLNTYSFDLLYK